jgi:hypothetical protein
MFLMMFTENHPEIDCFCYAFAPPAIVSKELEMKYSDKILSYVNNNDIVPRASLDALEDLKNDLKIVGKINLIFFLNFF